MTDFDSIDHTPRVLIVEDEARYRDLLLRALPDMGFEGAGAGSGEEAMRLMKEQPFHILVLDLNLPGMHGLELLEKVRGKWPDIRVVILTGFGDLDVAKQAIRLGVDDFLTKPCHLGELEAALERARRKWKPKLPDLSAAGIEEETPEQEEVAAAPPPHDEAKGAASLRDVERQHILAALSRHEGNREAAAKELGISVRKLYYRLAEYQQQGFLDA
jgi:DNA-binding NtrC family response regulator